jgi:hypothetical protein
VTAKEEFPIDEWAMNLAQMITQWVDGGIAAEQNWRTPLHEIIQLRLRRLLEKHKDRLDKLAVSR